MDLEEKPRDGLGSAGRGWGMNTKGGDHMSGWGCAGYHCDVQLGRMNSVAFSTLSQWQLSQEENLGWCQYVLNILRALVNFPLK